MKRALLLTIAVLLLAGYGSAWQPEIDIHDGDGRTITYTAFAPNGSYIATGDDGGTVEIWSVDPFHAIHEFGAHTGYVRTVQYSPDGQYLATGGDDGYLRMWNATTMEAAGNMTIAGGSIRTADFSPDSSMIAFAGSDSTVQVQESDTQVSVRALSPFGSTVVSTRWSGDGTMLYVAEVSGTVTVFDTTTWGTVDTITTSNGSIYSMDVSADGQYVATGHSDHTVAVWGANGSGRVHNHSIHAGPVYSVVFSPNSSVLASGSDGSSPIYSTSTSVIDDPVPLVTNSTVCAPTGVSFSYDGARLAAPLCTWVAIQVMDSDGDGITDPHDGCREEAGAANDTPGCPDSDGDGVSDGADAFPSDPTEWSDMDSDGVGDNSDACPTTWGNASYGVSRGCPDTDGDGWADRDDVFPSDPTEWNDTDSDGYGDNSDDCPTEPGPVSGCPEEQNNGTNNTNNNTNNTNNNTNNTGNGTNGTGNETNQTGNETDPGNETGGNETGNNSTGNGTDINGTDNTGNGTENGTGTNSTGGNDTGPGNDTTPVPNNQSGNVSDEGNSGETAVLTVAMGIMLAAGIAVTIVGAGAMAYSFSSRYSRRRVVPPATNGFGDHPTLVVDALPEFVEEPLFPEDEVVYTDPNVHMFEAESPFENQIEYVKSTITPIIDESNKIAMRELKQIESHISQVYHERDMAERRYKRLMGDIDQLRRGLDNLIPLNI